MSYIRIPERDSTPIAPVKTEVKKEEDDVDAVARKEQEPGAEVVKKEEEDDDVDAAVKKEKEGGDGNVEIKREEDDGEAVAARNEPEVAAETTKREREQEDDGDDAVKMENGNNSSRGGEETRQTFRVLSVDWSERLKCITREATYVRVI